MVLKQRQRSSGVEIVASRAYKSRNAGPGAGTAHETGAEERPVSPVQSARLSRLQWSSTGVQEQEQKI